MLCAHCKNRNPVGNKFCRECGAKLAVPQDVLAAEEAARAEVERTQERVARLLTDAHALAEQNKFEQAILLAEEAAERMPNSTSAHSLLARLYEQVGANAKAIAAIERVVALNPESEADRLTLDRLRNAETASPGVRLVSPSVTPAMSKPTAAQSMWLPVAAAGMVGAFVLGIGLSVVSNRNAETPEQRSRTKILNTAQTGPAENLAGASMASQGTAAVPGGTIAPGAKINLPPPSDASDDPFASQNPAPSATTQNAAAQATQASGNRPTSSVASANSSLPIPSNLVRNRPDSRPSTLGPAPVKLIGVPTSANPPAAANSGGNSGGFGQGGRISVGNPSASASESTAQTQTSSQPQGDGYISISVRPPQTAGASVNSGARSASGLDTSLGPLLRAQSQQSAGQYQEAIASYQMAVSNDPNVAGEAYQGIGLCYQRLGDTGSARAAYRNAIAGYERQSASGRGGSAAQRGIASCKAALEVLGG
jgi:tetratricopeptide (TPR) repeat protein